MSKIKLYALGALVLYMCFAAGVGNMLILEVLFS